MQIALATGLALALSSTAIVLQSLQEKGLSGTTGGKSAFSVLLFQDIAVIPILATFPLLATLSPAASDNHGHGGGSACQDWLSHQPGWVNTLLVFARHPVPGTNSVIFKPSPRSLAMRATNKATRMRPTFMFPIDKSSCE